MSLQTSDVFTPSYKHPPPSPFASSNSRFSQAQKSDFHVMLSRFILAQLCICVSLIVAALHQTLKIALCQTKRQQQDLIVALIRRQREKWVDE
jgi:hypothetical protein